MSKQRGRTLLMQMAADGVRESDHPEYLRMREETLITGLRRAGMPE